MAHNDSVIKLRTIASCTVLAALTALLGSAPALARDQSAVLPGGQQSTEAIPPPAPLAEAHRLWLEEDVAYIISPREREVFEVLASDEERDLFIERFWRVRDPTPGTLTNEVRNEHNRRVKYANDQLGRETPRRGWQTDRGRTYIQLGEPRDIGRHYDPKGFWPMELWSYAANPGASGLPPFFYVLFFRPEMHGEYTIYDPFVDGPSRLAKSITMQMAEPQVIIRELIQGIGYEIAHAALSSNVSERPDFAGGRPSIGNEILRAQIGEAPFVGLDTGYAEAFLTHRGNVEASVAFDAMPLGMAAMAFWDQRGLPYLHYALLIPAERVMLAEYDEDYYLSLAVNVKISDLRGESIETGGDALEEHFDERQAQALIRSPLAFYDRIALVSGVYDLNIEVLNRVNDEGALARARLSVAAAPPDAAALSDLLVAGAAQRVDRPVERAFQFDDTQFVPAVSGRVNTGGPMYLFAQLVDGGRQPAPGDVVDLTATLIDTDGNEVDVITGAPIPLRPAPAPTSLMLPMPLEGVAPGHYTVRLAARLPGNRTLSREKAIEVVVAGTVRDPMVLLAGEQPQSLSRQYQTRAAQHLRKGEPRAAIAYFRAALDQDATAQGTRRALAQTLNDVDEHAEAARTIAPLAQSPAATAADVLILSIALRRAGEPTGAAQTARALLARWRPTTAAHNALGDALLALGENVEAAEAFRDSLALDPEQPEILDKLARISG